MMMCSRSAAPYLLHIVEALCKLGTVAAEPLVRLLYQLRSAVAQVVYHRAFLWSHGIASPPLVQAGLFYNASEPVTLSELDANSLQRTVRFHGQEI